MAAALFVGAQTVGDTALLSPLDKVVHFVYFATMAVLMALALGRRWLWVVLLVVPAVGAVDEWHQLTIIGRDASVWDWLADVAGVSVGVAGCWRMIWVKERAA